MKRSIFFLFVTLLAFAVPVKAESLVGTIHISAIGYPREGLAPLWGQRDIIKLSPELYSVIGTKWNDIQCNASAWEFVGAANPPDKCPKEFHPHGPVNPYYLYRIPPILPIADWRGTRVSKTVPLQFLNDYKADFTLFDFSTKKEGQLPHKNPSLSPQARPLALLTIGDIVLNLGNVVPPGWLPADGRSVSKVEYPHLYRAIGDRYTDEISEGQDTFDLPLLSTAVIFHDGAYKDITPMIRATEDAYAPAGYHIGDIIISANPNRTLELNISRFLTYSFSPIDEKKRTLPITEYPALYTLLGDRFGAASMKDMTVTLPRISRKADANDVDRVFFYLVTNGNFPVPADEHQ